jgi:hypothetical protein
MPYIYTYIGDDSFCAEVCRDTFRKFKKMAIILAKDDEDLSEEAYDYTRRKSLKFSEKSINQFLNEKEKSTIM